MKKEDGFTIPSFLFITFSLSVMVIAIASLVNSYNKKIEVIKDSYYDENCANTMLQDILDDFQSLANIETDNSRNEIFGFLHNKYLENNIVIKDVSTSINRNFLSKEILNNKYIQEYCLNKSNEFFTDYGWINTKCIDSASLLEIKKTFNFNDLYPLVNSLPLYNVNYMNEDFLLTILNTFKIDNAKEKAKNIIINCNEKDLEKEDLLKLLNVNSSNQVMFFLGTKTTFWNITFETNKCNVKAILAGVPFKTDKIFNIEKYILIEKTISPKSLRKNAA